MLLAQQLKESYRLILGYIGTILLGLAVALLIPLLSLIAFPGEIIYLKNFLIPSGIAAVLGLLLRQNLKYRKEASLSLKQGGVIVVASWFLVMLISAIPFFLLGTMEPLHSIFESVSGWTTTGLTVVDVGNAPNIYLLWRSLMQFLGGAGLAVIMLSAIIGPHGFGLYNAEGRSDKLLPNVVKSTKLIMTIYFGYFSAGAVLYIFAGMPWFDSVNHSLAALSTGGFSTKINSIGAYNSLAIELVTIILMLLGTTNFAAHYLLLRGKIRQFARIGEVRFIFLLIIIFSPVVTFFSLVKIYESVGESLRTGIFQIITAVSTTGYSTADFNNWDNFSVFIIILLMIVGGGIGATAGGVKSYRIYVLIKSFIWNIKSYFLPKNIVRKNYIYKPEGKYYVTRSHVVRIANFVMIYILFYLAGSLVLMLSGYSMRESLFEFGSAVGTVGLSVGITSPTAPDVVLWTEIAGMIFGRLEFFVIIFAFLQIVKDLISYTRARKKIRNT
ncbi:MAG: TrkH family potassium uptake protein [Candidatus Humimicrobiaceae bacterium]